MPEAETLLLWTALPLCAVACAWFVASRVLRGPEDSFFVSLLRAPNQIYCRVLFGVKRPPEEGRLPIAGPCIVVANHQGGADPLIVSAATRRWIRFLMAREYYDLFYLRWAFRRLQCIPVNRDGNDLSSFRAALKVLQSGKALGIFPQGEINLEDEAIEGGKAGVALLALKSGAPVVPLYLDGAPAHDNVLVGLTRPSRTYIFTGSPRVYAPAGKKPTREEIDRVTDEILESIRELRQDAKPDARLGEDDSKATRDDRALPTT